MKDFFDELNEELKDTKSTGKSKKPVEKTSPKKQTTQQKDNKTIQPKGKKPSPVKKVKKPIQKKNPYITDAKIVPEMHHKGIQKDGFLSVKNIGTPTTFPKPDEPVIWPKLEKGNTRVMPVAGLRKVGNNMTLIQHGDEIVIVDIGLEFAAEEMHGADYLVPDVRFLMPIKDKITGIFITHAHLDHIGGLKNTITALGYPPIYGSPFTIKLIQKIFNEVGLLNKVKFITINPDEKKLRSHGAFKFEYFRVSHSIPDSCGIYFETPSAKIMHMGDYKVELAPTFEPPTDLANFARIGGRGIDFLIQESTNSPKSGWSTREATVEREIKNIIRNAAGRVIVGNFASLLSRVQAVLNVAEETGRYVFINGRSMVENVAIAKEMGLLKFKPNTLKKLDTKNIKDTPENKQIIITTGSQGEQYGGLGLMSRGDHRIISIKPRDTILFSSSIVPGNEMSITNLKNKLYRFGCKIITIQTKEIHSGGHGTLEEQKIVVNAIKPRYILPMHGDLNQRLALKRGMVEIGYDPKQVLMLEDGHIVEMNTKKECINTRKKIKTEIMIVDGKGIGELKSHIIKDRGQMRESGVVVVVYKMRKDKTIDDFIKVETRGFMYAHEVKDIHNMLIKKARQAWESATQGDTSKLEDKNIVKSIRNNLERFILQKTEREPMVIPTIVNI